MHLPTKEHKAKRDDTKRDACQQSHRAAHRLVNFDHYKLSFRGFDICVLSLSSAHLDFTQSIYPIQRACTGIITAIVSDVLIQTKTRTLRSTSDWMSGRLRSITGLHLVPGLRDAQGYRRSCSTPVLGNWRQDWTLQMHQHYVAILTLC